MVGRRLRTPAALAAALTCAALSLSGAQALAAPAGYTEPAGTGSAHANLLVNPGAQAGAYSLRGWDAVTIPGWQVVSGLPSVVRYGSTMLPAVTGHGAAVKNGQLFVGGPGGTARLRQVVSLRSASGSLQPAGSRYTLSALLGADRRDSASAKVTFYSAAGRKLGQASIGPVRGRGKSVPMHYRSGSGRIPAGAATANVVLTLATTLKNIDGPYSPYFGFGRAVADNIRFSVSSPVRQRVLTAPAVKVPRYQHVFLFYFENQDYNAVIGNTRQAPFINSLLPHASLLSDFFAEEHPSDGNYLALAGGSTFGIPLTDPLEENSQYTIDAPNIGDLIGTAHENWKAYLQSAAGPCDDTVHGYYWDDDMPMTYFADVRDQPAYCSAHLVPLESLQPDLARAATTPAFSWVSPNDCTDMEGCGIRSGDEFLATELGQIMKSPAWTTQRSLAIITFDEDDTDHQNPAQRVPTIVIGSAGVRPGYVSHVRYTHYSLLRTIEGALGLGTLTANDRYAQPLNDIFTPGQAASAQPAAATGQASASAPASVTASAPVSVPAGSRAGPPPRQQTAFVVNSASNSVTPVNLVTRKAGKPVKVGRAPDAIAITPDGRTAYVVNSGSGTVTPIATGSGKAGTADPGRRRPAVHRHRSRRRDCLRHGCRLGRGHPDRPGDRPGARSHSGRPGTACDRHHARRPDRPRPRLGRRLGYADQHAVRPGRGADPGRRLPVRHLGRAGRPDSVRRQLRLGHRDADQHPGQARRAPGPGWPDTGRPCDDPGQRHGVRGRRRLRHRHPDDSQFRAARPGSDRWPGDRRWLRARRSRGRSIGPDGIRGQHDLRNGNAGQRRDPHGGQADLGRPVLLPDSDHAVAIRLAGGRGRYLR